MKKYTELLILPIAFILLVLYNQVGSLLGWPLYGLEVFQGLFIGYVKFLAVIGLARVTFLFQFPGLYRLVDDDLNENKLWDALNTTQRTIAGLVLLGLYYLLLTWQTASL